MIQVKSILTSAHDYSPSSLSMFPKLMDIPFSLIPLLMTAMDHTEKDTDLLLLEPKPNIVLYDFAHWLPSLGIESVHYFLANLIAAAYVESTDRQWQGNNVVGVDHMHISLLGSQIPPSSFMFMTHVPWLLSGNSSLAVPWLSRSSLGLHSGAPICRMLHYPLSVWIFGRGTCERQTVLLPNIFDQILNARLISSSSSSLKAGVEFERGKEDGLITWESVCKAVKTVMDDGSEVGGDVRTKHAKLRRFLLSKDLESTYIDNFCHKLQDLLG